MLRVEAEPDRSKSQAKIVDLASKGAENSDVPFSAMIQSMIGFPPSTMEVIIGHYKDSRPIRVHDPLRTIKGGDRKGSFVTPAPKEK